MRRIAIVTASVLLAGCSLFGFLFDNRLEEVRVFNAGESEPYRRHVYEYQGSVASGRTTYDESDNIEWTTEYSYNADLQWTGGIRYDTSNATILSFSLRYNTEGDLIEIEYLDADDVTTLRIVYTYDAEGLLERGNRYDGNDDAIGYLEFTTDNEGNILERHRYSNLGTLLDSREMSYDSDGNRTRVNEFDASDTLTKYITFTYQFGTPLPNAWVVS